MNDEVVIKQLTEAWEFDRCLQLVFVLLDQDEKRSIKDAAAELANRFLGQNQIFEKVLSRFFSTHIPGPEFFAPGWLYADQHPNISKLLAQIEVSGPAIQKLATSWDEIPTNLFESPREKLQRKELLIENFEFLLLANALEDRPAFDREHLKCQVLLKDFPNSREILKIWLNDLAPKKKSICVDLESEGDQPEDSRVPKQRQTDRQRHQAESETRVSNHHISAMVTEKKQPIFDLIDAEDSSGAIELANKLLHFQLKNGGAYFASKSLCDFAQHAKTKHLLNLQNEFCQLAVSVLPDDGWSRGQLADSFFGLSRYTEAMAEFERCLELDEGAFGATGIARIYKRKGNLQQSLQLFENAKSDYPDVPSPSLGRAEVLRELRRWEECLEEYEECTEVFPDERIGFCGLAAVFTDMGRFNEARKVYGQVIEMFGEDPVALGGYADTFAKEERYSDAIKAYDEAIRKFPNEVLLIAGRANVLRADKQYELAKSAFKLALERFDNEPMFLTGLAEVYRANGEFVEAEELFDKTIEKYPFDAWGWIGKASSLKSRRQYEEALKEFDKTLSQFPYNFFALSGRADVLKCLGLFDQAVKAYERLGRLSKDKRSVAPAMAAIRGAQKQYAAAMDLLGEMPVKSPSTRDDWIANHVYGMVLLRKGDLDKAERVFQFGVDECTWSKERRYFVSGLAIIQIRNGNLNGAESLIRKPNSAFEHILSFQVNSALGNHDRSKESREHLELKCPPVLVGLRDNLFQINENKLPDELFDQICFGGLLRLAA